MIKDVVPTGMTRPGAADRFRDGDPASLLLSSNEAAAAARADAKIAEWRAYLPEDCVKAMIRDGWHFTT